MLNYSHHIRNPLLILDGIRWCPSEPNREVAASKPLISLWFIEDLLTYPRWFIITNKQNWGTTTLYPANGSEMRTGCYTWRLRQREQRDELIGASGASCTDAALGLES